MATAMDYLSWSVEQAQKHFGTSEFLVSTKSQIESLYQTILEISKKELYVPSPIGSFLFVPQNQKELILPKESLSLKAERKCSSMKTPMTPLPHNLMEFYAFCLGPMVILSHPNSHSFLLSFVDFSSLLPEETWSALVECSPDSQKLLSIVSQLNLRSYGLLGTKEGKIYWEPTFSSEDPIALPIRILRTKGELGKEKESESNVLTLEYWREHTREDLGPPCMIPPKWHLGAPLAQGSFGQVFNLCQDEVEKDCHYVLKKTQFQNVLDLRNHQREAKNTKILGEQKLSPQLYDAFQCQKYGYLIMEKILGLDLMKLGIEQMKYISGELPRNIKIPESVIPLALFDIQLCLLDEQVRKLNELGFLHGDLKPNNMILTRDAGGKDSIHLIDFGSTYGSKDPEIWVNQGAFSNNFGCSETKIKTEEIPSYNLWQLELALTMVHIVFILRTSPSSRPQVQVIGILNDIYGLSELERTKWTHLCSDQLPMQQEQMKNLRVELAREMRTELIRLGPCR